MRALIAALLIISVGVSVTACGKPRPQWSDEALTDKGGE